MQALLHFLALILRCAPALLRSHNEQAIVELALRQQLAAYSQQKSKPEITLVAFSCKGRGFCPSCTSRRMSDTAAHLVDRVLPEAPVRQWVLSLPIPLRYRVAYDHKLCSAVLAVFLRAVFGALRHRAKNDLGVVGARSGSVTFVQRFGGSINLHTHFHALVLDGVYADPEDTGAPRFFTLSSLPAMRRSRG
jgi:hypothetical protein